MTWPFDEPTNLAVFSVATVLEGKVPIGLVTHDDDDGTWQFLPSAGVDEQSEAVVVALEEIYRQDPSVGDLADLPYGWRAWRECAESPWHREKKAYRQDDDR